MIITISREYGAGGSEAARRVATALGWRVLDNEVVEQVAARAGLAPEAVAEREERAPGFGERLAACLAASAPEYTVPATGLADLFDEERRLVKLTEEVVAEAAREGRVVLVGRAAPAVIAQTADALHVKLVGPREHRVYTMAQRLGIDLGEAARLVDETDASRARYHRDYYGRDWADPLHYHLVLNTGLLTVGGAAEVITAAARCRGW